MSRYVVNRLLGMIPTALVLLLMVVLLVRLLPGNAVDLLLQGVGGTAQQKQQAHAQLSHQLGLDQSLPRAYLGYLAGAIHGDLGRSLWDKHAVAPLVLQRLGITGELALIAAIIGFLFSLPIGVLSAVRKDSWLDYTARSISILAISIPSFVIATAILVIPAITVGWAPQQGFVSIFNDPLKHFSLVLLPAAVLGLGLAGSLMRLLRTTMLEVMRQDYIRTAAAKGLRERTVLYRHALKNALIPVVSLFSLQLAFLIGGSVIVESIFGVPGLGRLLLAAITGRDYPLIQGIVVVVGLLIMIVNLLTDLSYAAIDPRIRFA